LFNNLKSLATNQTINSSNSVNLANLANLNQNNNMIDSVEVEVDASNPIESVNPIDHIDTIIENLPREVKTFTLGKNNFEESNLERIMRLNQEKLDNDDEEEDVNKEEGVNEDEYVSNGNRDKNNNNLSNDGNNISENDNNINNNDMNEFNDSINLIKLDIKTEYLKGNIQTNITTNIININ